MKPLPIGTPVHVLREGRPNERGEIVSVRSIPVLYQYLVATERGDVLPFRPDEVHPVETILESCGVCHFFKSMVTYGDCRRHAPVAGFNAAGAMRTGWPSVFPDQWCGEFELGPPPIPVGTT